MRGAVVWTGFPDPGGTREGVRKNCDPEMAAVPSVLEGVKELGGDQGITVPDLIERSECPTAPPALREALLVLCPCRDGKLERAAQIEFHHLAGRVFR